MHFNMWDGPILLPVSAQIGKIMSSGPNLGELDTPRTRDWWRTCSPTGAHECASGTPMPQRCLGLAQRGATRRAKQSKMRTTRLMGAIPAKSGLEKVPHGANFVHFLFVSGHKRDVIVANQFRVDGSKLVHRPQCRRVDVGRSGHVWAFAEQKTSIFEGQQLAPKMAKT